MNLGFHFEVIVVVLKEKELSSLRKYNGNTVARRGLGCSDASRCTRDPTPLVLARRSKADLTNSTTTARRRQQGQQGCDFRFFLFRDVSSKLPQFSTLF